MISVEFTILYPAEEADRMHWTMTMDVAERTRACDVEICCPACGRPMRLDGYTVTANGTVTPTFECKAGCGFKGILCLRGWS